jgi:hypothetical protein
MAKTIKFSFDDETSMSPEYKYLRLTAELNALDYFERVVSFIRETQSSDIAWKWVAISLHGALYGFAVSACYGTDCMSVLVGKNKNHLIGIDEAIKRCEEGREGRVLTLSAGERKSLDDLKRLLRDDFEHFRPQAYSIELHGITTLAIDCIRVIEALATTGWVAVRLSDDQQERIAGLAAEARSLLLNSPLHLELQSVAPHATLASHLEQTNPQT